MKEETEEVMVALWADGTFCYEEEIEEYLGFMSDDYMMINEDKVDK